MARNAADKRAGTDNQPIIKESQCSVQQRAHERILFGHEVDWVNGEKDTEGWHSDVRPASHGGHLKRFGVANADTRCTTETLVELVARDALRLTEGKPTVGMLLGIASELEAFPRSEIQVTFSGEMCGPADPHHGIILTGLNAIVDGSDISNAFTDRFHELHEGYNPDNLTEEPFEWDGHLVYSSWWDH